MSVHSRSIPAAAMVIVSANEGGSIAVEVPRAGALLRCALHWDAQARFVCGAWKNKSESAVLMTARAYIDMICADALAVDLVQRQEAILWLAPPEGHSGLRPARLKTPIALVELADLGYFHHCKAEEAGKAEGWTYDPVQRRYYICAHAADRLVGETVAQAVARWRPHLAAQESACVG